MKKSLSASFFSVFLLFNLVINAAWSEPTAAAAPKTVKISDERYATTLVAQSPRDPVAVAPGKSVAVTFSFKNKGKVAWVNSGKNYISAYTMEPRYRASAFRGKGWLSASQTNKMTGTIQPGQTGKLVVNFTTPKKAGAYTEKFYLSAENKTWVKGGEFYVKFNVVAPGKKSTEDDLHETAPPKDDDTDFTPTVSAHRMFKSVSEVTANGGDQINIVVGYQNNGATPWTNYQFTAVTTGTTQSVFADASWADGRTLFTRTQTVAANDLMRDTITFRAPAQAGIYTASFNLAVNGQIIPGAILNLPVTVTSDAPAGYQAPNFAPPVDPLTTEIPRLSEEPRIRVGIWKPETNVQFISTDDEYIIFQGKVTSTSILPRGTAATLTFDKTLYTLESTNLFVTSSEYLRLEPAANPHAVFTLTNFERNVTWKGNRNFNQYRGAMELREARDAASSLYVINDLLMEDYVNGIGENSNAAPPEYLKSQATAQRTYAYYMKVYSTKHNSRNFDVVAHTGDQLYLGYGSEQIMGNFVAAASATRGSMVTYNNNVVITPYFGNTDGRTRSWVEVWGGGEKPWLVPVAATYDARDRRRMNGHGVGMSQLDAAYRASEEKLDWQALLKYYYTGTEVHRIYP